MRQLRRLASVAAALIAFPSVFAALAYAHAMLLRADPAPEAVLGVQPSLVRLWFNEPIEIASKPSSCWIRRGGGWTRMPG